MNIPLNQIAFSKISNTSSTCMSSFVSPPYSPSTNTLTVVGTKKNHVHGNAHFFRCHCTNTQIGRSQWQIQKCESRETPKCHRKNTDILFGGGFVTNTQQREV